jgi:hypothetical protein
MVMSKQHTIEPRQTVAEAEGILVALQAKRVRLVARGVEIGDQCAAVAYDAHAAGNAKAEKTLADLRREGAEHASLLASLDSAIKVAGDKVLIARAYEADIADQAKAQQVRELVGALREAGHELDDACRTLSEMSRVVGRLLAQLHGLGIKHPSYEQWDVFGDAALKTAIAGTPWVKRYRIVAPLERKQFGTLIDGWAASIEARIKPQLKQTDEAA